jgi:bacterioferritin
MSAVPQQQPPRNILTDVKTLREQARRHIEEGAVTENYGADREKVLQLLNEALATELVCVLRYRHDYFMARGIHASAVAAEFLEHSNAEQGHADRIAERMVQLGGEPDFNPNAITGRSHAEYRIGRTLPEAIKENLVAERIAIDSYREMVQYIGDSDPTTRRMLEEILAVEEEHADDLADLLQQDQARQ